VPAEVLIASRRKPKANLIHVNLGNSNRHCGPQSGSREDAFTFDRAVILNLHQGLQPMHLSHPRPTAYVPSTSAATIPPTQVKALDRRHLLDQQQRTFQATHAEIRNDNGRRRPPA